MPTPVSAKVRRTYCPGVRSSSSLMSSPERSRLASSSLRRPPSGMASRAFSARFSTALSTWAVSTRVFHSPGSARTSMAIASPTLRVSRSDMSPSCRPRLTTLGSSGWRRAKARSWRVSCAARSAPRRALLRRRLAVSSPASRGARSSRLAWMTCSRLLKSWATPPVSWPIASMRWARRLCSSTRVRSLMSRAQPTMRTTRPRSNTGAKVVSQTRGPRTVSIGS